MKLTFIRKTRSSGDTNCPALFRADDGGYVVVGVRVAHPDDLAQVTTGVGAGEVAVWIPRDVIEGHWHA